MSRDYVDYEQDTNQDLDIGGLRSMPQKMGLSFKSRDQLKREVWDNARAKGWLA